MNPPGTDPLLLAGKAVTILMQAIMAIGAAVLAISVPFVTIFSGDLAEGFADGSGIVAADLPLPSLVGTMVIAFIILAALFLFLSRLRAIIDTVAAGDPFIPANAERLNAMAWLLLATQILVFPLIALTLVVGEWAQELDDVDLELGFDGFDLTGILMVLVLFILARVFRHGAALREDLEGTV